MGHTVHHNGSILAAESGAVASWRGRGNFGFSENCWKILLLENFRQKNAKFGYEKSPFSESFKGKMKILSTRNLLYRKYSQPSVGNLQLFKVPPSGGSSPQHLGARPHGERGRRCFFICTYLSSCCLFLSL